MVLERQVSIVPNLAKRAAAIAMKVFTSLTVYAMKTCVLARTASDQAGLTARRTGLEVVSRVMTTSGFVVQTASSVLNAATAKKPLARARPRKTLCASALNVLLVVKVVALLAMSGNSKMNLASPIVKSASMVQWVSIALGKVPLEIMAVRTVYANDLPHHEIPTPKSMRTAVLRRPSRERHATWSASLATH
jgi:hypothetical protein